MSETNDGNLSMGWSSILVEESEEQKGNFYKEKGLIEKQ